MEAIKIVARNRKASHDFFLSDRVEAGLVLKGPEIKSIRAGQVSIREAHVRIINGEAWLIDAHIAQYDPASQQNHEPKRPRKLLLHGREIRRFQDRVYQKGYTIIPTKMYLRDGMAKVEIALARGKRKYDKRREIAARDAQRAIERAVSRKARRAK